MGDTGLKDEGVIFQYLYELLNSEVMEAPSTPSSLFVSSRLT